MKFKNAMLILLAGLALVVLPSSLYSQVIIEIPDTTTCQNDTLTLSVILSGVDVADSLIAFEADIRFDTTALELGRVDQDETVCESWGLTLNTQTPGQIRAAAYSAYAAQWEAGPQALINLTFHTKHTEDVQTEIRVEAFDLFGLDGAIPVDTLKHSTLGLWFNDPPVILDGLSVRLHEDETAYIDYSTWISDPDHGLAELDIHIETDSVHFSLNVNEQSRLLELVPELNWSGTQSFEISVTDPLGFADTAEVMVMVIPLPDPPGAFHLITPEHDSTFTEPLTQLAFSWSRSANVDPAPDFISYMLYLAGDSLLTGAETFIVADTSIILSRSLSEGTWWWGVKAMDTQGNSVWCTRNNRFQFDNSAVHPEEGLPKTFHLSGNYPNPFNPETVLEYQVPQNARVEITVFDALGRRVTTLLSANQAPGSYTIRWNGLNSKGTAVPSGVYFCRMKAGGFTAQQKMLLVR